MRETNDVFTCGVSGKEKSITSESADSALLQIKVDYGETKAFIVLSRELTQEAL